MQLIREGRFDELESLEQSLTSAVAQKVQEEAEFDSDGQASLAKWTPRTQTATLRLLGIVMAKEWHQLEGEAPWAADIDSRVLRKTLGDVLEVHHFLTDKQRSKAFEKSQIYREYHARVEAGERPGAVKEDLLQKFGRESVKRLEEILSNHPPQYEGAFRPPFSGGV